MILVITFPLKVLLLMQSYQEVLSFLTIIN